ncbi:GNAT family N-acetyltransferase [Arthrobacter sp. NPDC056886]|uniref:GNAT family N-acetyltransferase n=1 Tax=Arthrobacter sp. NPDC056886 TaxID=3345960 RepID=UPI003671B2F5
MTTTDSAKANVTVRPPSPEDHEEWTQLFRGYREFYSLAPDEEVVQRVWQWIQRGTHGVRAVLAIADDKPIGFAHYREFARPSSGTVGVFLDDLFTHPDARNLGAGRALIGHLSGIADRGSYSVLRWITASDNVRARALYDDVAQATAWVTYDIKRAGQF